MFVLLVLAGTIAVGPHVGAGVASYHVTLATRTPYESRTLSMRLQQSRIMLVTEGRNVDVSSLRECQAVQGAVQPLTFSDGPPLGPVSVPPPSTVISDAGSVALVVTRTVDGVVGTFVSRSNIGILPEPGRGVSHALHACWQAFQETDRR